MSGQLAEWPPHNVDADAGDNAGDDANVDADEVVLAKEDVRAQGFLTGFAHGEIWMRDAKTGIRIQLGTVAGTSLQDADVKVLACLGRYVFVGAKRGSRNVLQVFDVGPVLGDSAALRAARPDSLALDFESHSKHRGLGAVRAISESSQRGQAVLVVCGRGIGKAHLWRFWLKPGRAEVDLDYVGGIATRTNTIDGLGLSACGTRIVATSANEDVAQVWQLPSEPEEDSAFELRSGSAERIGADLAALQTALLGDHAAAALLEKDHLGLDKEPSVDEVISSRGGAWKQLFPPRLLDPAAYDGDLDENGLAHGIGSQLLDARGHLLYTGEWKHGQRHGVGQVVDERSNKIVYVGGWRHGRRHGFGLELRTGSTDTGEVYEGWWRNGARHGLGSVYLSKQASGLTADSISKERIRYVGFFHEGKQHGLGWWTWPSGSPLLPFAVTLDAMKHLGAVRCIVQFKDGQFFDEFNFHRVDGKAIARHEQSLFNFPARRRAKFADHADGRWTGAECWGCMSSANMSPLAAAPPAPASSLGGSMQTASTWVTCGNPQCGMRMHLDCLGRTARQFPSWELARAMYCEELEDSEARQLRQHVGEHLVFYCPMPACQEMALALPRVANTDADDAKTAATNEPEGHSQKTKALDAALTGKNETQELSKAHAAKMTKKKSTKKKKDARTISRLQRSIPLDEKAYLEESMNAQPFAGAKLPGTDGPYAFYNAEGEVVVLETDEDIEDALEHASLAGAETLHIFKLAVG